MVRLWEFDVLGPGVRIRGAVKCMAQTLGLGFAWMQALQGGNVFKLCQEPGDLLGSRAYRVSCLSFVVECSGLPGRERLGVHFLH